MKVCRIWQVMIESSHEALLPHNGPKDKHEGDQVAPDLEKKNEKTTTNNEQALILLKALLLVVAVWVANPNLDQSLL